MATFCHVNWETGEQSGRREKSAAGAPGEADWGGDTALLGPLGLSSLCSGPHQAACLSRFHGMPQFSDQPRPPAECCCELQKINFLVIEGASPTPCSYTGSIGKDLTIFPGLVRHLVSLNLEKPKGVPWAGLTCDLALGPGQSGSGFLGQTWTVGWDEKLDGRGESSALWGR